jgi:hypothetical protein
MNHYCCTTDPKLLNANVLSVSDEAFLLLVFINGAQGGCQKLNKITERYLFVLTDATAIKLFPHTFVQCTQNNRAWTEDQELAMTVGVSVCFA